MPESRIFNMENIPFNAIRENRILGKIPEFSVCTANELGGGITSMERSYQAICQRNDLKTNYTPFFGMAEYKQDKGYPAFH